MKHFAFLHHPRREKVKSRRGEKSLSEITLIFNAHLLQIPALMLHISLRDELMFDDNHALWRCKGYNMSDPEPLFYLKLV